MAAESAVRVIFLGDSSSAVRSVSRLETAFGGLGRTAKLAAGALAVGVVGGLAAATKAAIDFDRSMRNVNSIAKLSETQFQSLSKQVLALGKTTGQTPKVLADGLYDIVSSGFKANAAIKILSVSAKAATAGMTDTATASKAVVAILNAYGLQADKAKNVSSLLFKEVQLGVNTFEELATNIGDTAPLAAALKIPFSDVAAGLALITLHGTSMAEASTQMSRVMTDLLKPSDSLKKILHDLGYENGQAAIQAHGFIPLIKQLSDAAGGSAAKTADWFQNIRSLRGILNLTGPNLAKFNQFADQMALSFQKGGADVAAFNEQSKSISVQWAKAKSALIAASIPIGQLLFPLLSKAADKAEQFASGLQTHMPQIQATFQSLGGILQGVAATLGQISGAAISPVGSSGLLGLVAAFGTAKALGGILKWKDALFASEGLLATLGPVGIAAAAGIGILTGAFILMARTSVDLSGALNNVKDAIDGVSNAEHAARDSHFALEQAQINVQTSARGVTVAEKAYQDAVDQSGRKSAAAKQAFLGLRQARLLHKEAISQETDAEKRSAAASKNLSDAHKKTNQEIQALTARANDLSRLYGANRSGAQNAARALGDLNRAHSAYAHAVAVSGANSDVARAAFARVSSAARIYAQAQKAANSAPNPGIVNQYAAAMGNLTKAMGGTKAEAKNAVDVVKALADALGRLPTKKEVDIFVNTFQRGPTTRPGGRAAGRAGGGFIPMVPGASKTSDSVPAMLTPGEVVLNRAQQNVLGGPAFLASLFGFSGEAGPGFAAGGIVGGKSFLSKKPGPTPHKGRGHKSHTKAIPPWASKQVAGVLRHLHRLDDDKSYLDQEYSNLSTRFSIEDDDQTFVNDDGTINTAFVAQRTAELHDLVGERQKLFDKMEEQKKALVAAVKMLRKAIGQLLRNLRANEVGIRHDAEQLTKLSKELAKEKTKKKPNAGRVRSLESSIKGVRADMTSRGQAKNNINTARSTWGQQIADWGHDLRFLPLDEGGVLNDILELNQQLGYLGSSDLIHKHYGGGAGGGAAAGAATAPNLEGLGAAIGALQTGIIGSFQKGTLYVPQTGLAMVHTGETITPAGRGSGSDSQGPVQVLVHVTVEDGAVDKSKIRAVAVEATDQIMLKMGNSASERQRSGRF